MTHLISELEIPLILGQAGVTGLIDQVTGGALQLVKGILILLAGWIIANVAKGITKKLLEQTSIDNKIASWVTGRQDDQSIPVEKWVAEAVFWLILLLAFIGFLNVLQLEGVSQPLNAALSQITTFLPKLAGALLLLGLAWVLATVSKTIVTRVLGNLRLDERLGQEVGQNQNTLTETLGNAIYWFIFLFFLPSILSTLDLRGSLGPVEKLLNDILATLPNILAAVVIGSVGWFVANIIKRVVTNLLAATGVDRIGERFGLSPTSQRQSLSQILGAIVYLLVLIPFAITALEALKIQAISVPAAVMLGQILNLLPKLFAAAVILTLAYVGGQYLSELVTSILTGLGFNNLFAWLGISSPTAYTAEPTIPGPETGAKTVLQPSITTKRTPSEIAGLIVLVAIMLVASLTAVDILQIQALRTLVGVILLIAGKVFVGLIVFAIGLYLANMAFNLISSSGTGNSHFLGQAARIAIITLVGAMALQQMGIAPDIVNLAFGLLLGGIAVAIALAFGLGGREVANEQLREWLAHFKNKQ
ncbi:MAG: mechanosensitive ion channel [Gomphosphaeria aponina SAG 52.96 = DSM 107014]|uniref:Mechanosensitive ion channel n=1 Tax=Gomphosphaeria aponina SAG 52.96 = DSM 107014 TaxID=1521640 RepID=A0A941GYK1_9CHRO|nr:mechanosensitive ion channel [Gomphosphaeria aponina SAG 52.96 = DSM 107014]